MKKPIIRVYTEIGKFVDREMNDQEFAQYQADQIAFANEVQAETTKAATKAAVLAKLGLTAEEVAALLS
jgi:hypothetical protein